MTSTDAATGVVTERSPGPGRGHRRPRRPLRGGGTEQGKRAGTDAAPTWGLLPQFLLVMAAGVLLVALAYRRGWEQSASGDALYWVGELLIFLPATGRMISRSPAVGRRERLGLVLGVTAALYAVKYLYSPLAFKFPDELQHWRSATDILTTHHLFTPNASLPISPQFPGLEELTTALSSLTGLSVVTAGLLVAGLARLLLMLGLFELFRRVAGPEARTGRRRQGSAAANGRQGPERVAGFAALLYATSMHFQSFDAMFIYQALAIPLAVVVLVLLARAPDGTPRANRARVGIALVLTAAAVVTHHVTGFALLAVLALWAVVQWAGARRTPDWPRDRRPMLLAGACAAFLLLWDGLVATDTVGYLTPMLDTFRDLFGAGAQPAAGAGATPVPLFDQLTSYGAVAVVALLLAPAAWHVWRAQRHRPAAVVLTLASLSYYLVLGVRLASSDGPELAGRAFTYVYLPVAYVLAAGAMAALARSGGRPAAPAQGEWEPAGVAVGRARRTGAWAAAVLGRPAVVVMLTAVVFVGGITSGWPPFWERLPGPYKVSAFERSVEPEGIAAAQWTLAHLGPGNRFAADFTNYTLLGTYGDQDVVRNVADVYYSPVFGPAQVTQLADAGVQYLLVDLRLSTQLPAGGSYFPDDPQQDRHTTPIPRRDLTKFNSVPGIDRIYDGGDIVIYDVQEVLDAAQ